MILEIRNEELIRSIIETLDMQSAKLKAENEGLKGLCSKLESAESEVVALEVELAEVKNKITVLEKELVIIENVNKTITAKFEARIEILQEENTRLSVTHKQEAVAHDSDTIYQMKKIHQDLEREFDKVAKENLKLKKELKKCK